MKTAKTEAVKHTLGLIGTGAREICKYTAVLTGQIPLSGKKDKRFLLKLANIHTEGKPSGWVSLVCVHACVCLCAWVAML